MPKQNPYNAPAPRGGGGHGISRAAAYIHRSRTPPYRPQTPPYRPRTPPYRPQTPPCHPGAPTHAPRPSSHRGHGRGTTGGHIMGTQYHQRVGNQIFNPAIDPALVNFNPPLGGYRYPQPEQGLDLTVRTNPNDYRNRNQQPNQLSQALHRMRIRSALPASPGRSGFQGYSGPHAVPLAIAPPTISYRPTRNTPCYPSDEFSQRAIWEFSNLHHTVTSRMHAGAIQHQIPFEPNSFAQYNNMVNNPRATSARAILPAPPQYMPPMNIPVNFGPYNIPPDLVITPSTSQSNPPSNMPQASSQKYQKKRKQDDPAHYMLSTGNYPAIMPRERSSADQGTSHFSSASGPAVQGPGLNRTAQKEILKMCKKIFEDSVAEIARTSENQLHRDVTVAERANEGGNSTVYGSFPKQNQDSGPCDYNTLPGTSSEANRKNNLLNKDSAQPQIQKKSNNKRKIPDGSTQTKKVSTGNTSGINNPYSSSCDHSSYPSNGTNNLNNRSDQNQVAVFKKPYPGKAVRAKKPKVSVERTNEHRFYEDDLLSRIYFPVYMPDKRTTPPVNGGARDPQGCIEQSNAAPPELSSSAPNNAYNMDELPPLIPLKGVRIQNSQLTVIKRNPDVQHNPATVPDDRSNNRVTLQDSPDSPEEETEPAAGNDDQDFRVDEPVLCSDEPVHNNGLLPAVEKPVFLEENPTVYCGEVNNNLLMKINLGLHSVSLDPATAELTTPVSVDEITSTAVEAIKMIPMEPNQASNINQNIAEGQLVFQIAPVDENQEQLMNISNRNEDSAEYQLVSDNMPVEEDQRQLMDGSNMNEVVVQGLPVFVIAPEEYQLVFGNTPVEELQLVLGNMLVKEDLIQLMDNPGMDGNIVRGHFVSLNALVESQMQLMNCSNANEDITEYHLGHENELVENVQRLLICDSGTDENMVIDNALVKEDQKQLMNYSNADEDITEDQQVHKNVLVEEVVDNALVAEDQEQPMDDPDMNYYNAALALANVANEDDQRSLINGPVEIKDELGEIGEYVDHIGNQCQSALAAARSESPLDALWLLDILAHDPQVKDSITGTPYTNNGEDGGSSYNYYRLTDFQLGHLRLIPDRRLWRAYDLDRTLLGTIGVPEVMPERMEELEAFSRELIIEALRRDYNVQDVETLRLCVINYLKLYPEYKEPLLEKLVKNRQARN